jgi:hypothetical protein
MRSILLILAAFVIFAFQQANEFYHIIKVDGTIVNTSTGKNLIPGDNIKPNDRLEFKSPYATALVISNTRGKFTLKMPENKDLFDNKGDTKLLAMADNAVSPIDSRGMLATRGIGLAEVKDLKTYLGTDNFYLIGKTLSVKLNKTVYPLSEKQFLVFTYNIKNQNQSKKIGFSNQYLNIDRDALIKSPDDLQQGNSIKEVQVYKVDKTADKNDLITKFNLVFLDEEKLKQEFDVIIPFLQDQNLDRMHVIDYLKGYFNDVYGTTDADVLFQTVNKEVAKFFKPAQ